MPPTSIHEAEPPRYAGRPLLIILENYVLDCIGELQPDKQALTLSLVQAAFGGNTDWKLTVRRLLNFETKTEDAFRSLWEKN